MAKIQIDASAPVDIPALFERLDKPALTASANMLNGEPVLFAIAIMLTIRERDILLAALQTAHPDALAAIMTADYGIK